MREVTLPAIMQARDAWKASPAGQAVRFAAVPAAPAVVPALMLNVPPGAVGPRAVAMAIKLPTGPAPGVMPPAVSAPGIPANAAVMVAARDMLNNQLAAMYNPLSAIQDWSPPGYPQQPPMIGPSFVAPVGESPLVLFVLFI